MLSAVSSLAPVSLLLVLAGYLLGSVSGRALLSRWRSVAADVESRPDAVSTVQPEPRRFVLGALAIDVGKAAMAAWLALRLAPVGDPLSVTAHGYLAAMAALLGHAWPLWHRFRGSQPAPALAGALLAMWPVALAISVLIGLMTLLLTGYRGLAISIAALSLPLLGWWGGIDAPRFWFALGAAMLVLFAHRAHLLRLHAGTEPRFARARRLHRWRRR